MYGDVIAEQRKVGGIWWYKTVQYTTPYSFYMYYYMRLYIYTELFYAIIPACLLLLLSLHLHTYFALVISA